MSRYVVARSFVSCCFCFCRWCRWFYDLHHMW